MSRRSMMIQAVKRNLAKTKGPRIIIFPAWASRDGEPLVTWSLAHRTPTPDEIAAAVTQWKKEQAKQSHPIAAREGATPEEIDA